VARAKKMPIIHTRVLYNPPDFADGGVWIKKAPVLKSLVPGNKYAQFCKGVEPKKGELVTYLTNAINTRVDEAVTNGKLTKDQADKVKAETASRVAKLVDAVGGGKGPMGRPGGMRGRPGR